MPETTENPPSRVGGTFAPPLDENRLAAYRELAEKADAPVADAMNVLLKMVDAYHERPATKKGKAAAAGTPHPSGMGLVVQLPPEEVERIWDAVPWDHELEMYGKLFDGIDPANKALRDAAFHLQWYGRELFLDREPLTADRL